MRDYLRNQVRELDVLGVKHPELNVRCFDFDQANETGSWMHEFGNFGTLGDYLSSVSREHSSEGRFCINMIVVLEHFLVATIVGTT